MFPLDIQPPQPANVDSIELDNAATTVQKMFRGYHTREKVRRRTGYRIDSSVLEDDEPIDSAPDRPKKRKVKTSKAAKAKEKKVLRRNFEALTRASQSGIPRKRSAAPKKSKKPSATAQLAEEAALSQDGLGMWSGFGPGAGDYGYGKYSGPSPYERTEFGVPTLDTLFHPHVPKQVYEMAMAAAKGKGFKRPAPSPTPTPTTPKPSTPKLTSSDFQSRRQKRMHNQQERYDFVLESIVLPMVVEAANVGALVEHGRRLQREFERRVVKKPVFTSMLFDTVALPDTIGEISWDQMMLIIPELGRVCVVGRLPGTGTAEIHPFQIQYADEATEDTPQRPSKTAEMLGVRKAIETHSPVRPAGGEDDVIPRLAKHHPKSMPRLHSVASDPVQSLTYSLSHEGTLVCFDGWMESPMHSVNVFDKRDQRRVMPSEEILQVDSVKGLVYVNTTYEDGQIRVYNMKIGRIVRTFKVQLPKCTAAFDDSAHEDSASDGRNSAYSSMSGGSMLSASTSNYSLTASLLTPSTIVRKKRSYRLAVYRILSRMKLLIGRTTIDNRIFCIDMEAGVPVLELLGPRMFPAVVHVDLKAKCVFIAEGCHPEAKPLYGDYRIYIYMLETIANTLGIPFDDPAERPESADDDDDKDRKGDDASDTTSDDDDNDDGGGDDEDEEDGVSQGSVKEVPYEGAIPSMGPDRTLKGHVGPVTDVVHLPACKLLASSSYDGTVRFWDPTANPLPLTYESGIPIVRVGPGDFRVQPPEWTRSNPPFGCALVMDVKAVPVKLRVLVLDSGLEGLVAMTIGKGHVPRTDDASWPNDSLPSGESAAYDELDELMSGEDNYAEVSPNDSVGVTRRLVWCAVNRVEVLTSACDYDCAVSKKQLAECEAKSRKKWIATHATSADSMRNRMQEDALKLKELRAVDTLIFRAFRKAMFWRPSVYYAMTSKFLRDVYQEWKRRQEADAKGKSDGDPLLTVEGALTVLRSACRIMLPSINATAFYRKYELIVRGVPPEKEATFRFNTNRFNVKSPVNVTIFFELANHSDPLARLRESIQNLKLRLRALSLNSGPLRGAKRAAFEIETSVRHGQIVRLRTLLLPIDAKLRLRSVTFRREAISSQIDLKGIVSHGTVGMSFFAPNVRMSDDSGMPHLGVLDDQRDVENARQRLVQLLPSIRAAVEFATRVESQSRRLRSVHAGWDLAMSADIAVISIDAATMRTIQTSGRTYEQHLEAEIVLLSRVKNHPNLPQIVGVVENPLPPTMMPVASVGEKTDEPPPTDAFYLATELLSEFSPLSDILRRQGPLLGPEGERVLRYWGAEILRALVTLGEHGVVLRNLDAKNVLISHDGRRVKIASCESLMVPEYIHGEMCMIGPDHHFSGSPWSQASAAPEFFHKPPSKYTPKYDIWCFGALLYEMATGSPPPSYGAALARRIRAAQLVERELAFPNLLAEEVQSSSLLLEQEKEPEPITLSPRSTHYVYDMYLDHAAITENWPVDGVPPVEVPFSPIEMLATYPAPPKAANKNQPSGEGDEAVSVMTKETNQDEESSLEKLKQLHESLNTVGNEITRTLTLCDVVSVCLNTDPDMRPSAAILATCPYFSLGDALAVMKVKESVHSCMQQADAMLLLDKCGSEPLHIMLRDLESEGKNFDVSRIEGFTNVLVSCILPDMATMDDTRTLIIAGFPITSDVRRRLRGLAFSGGIVDGLVTLCLRAYTVTGKIVSLRIARSFFEQLFICLRSDDGPLSLYVTGIVFGLIRLVSGNERLGYTTRAFCPKCYRLHPVAAGRVIISDGEHDLPKLLTTDETGKPRSQVAEEFRTRCPICTARKRKVGKNEGFAKRTPIDRDYHADLKLFRFLLPIVEDAFSSHSMPHYREITNFVNSRGVARLNLLEKNHSGTAVRAPKKRRDEKQTMVYIVDTLPPFFEVYRDKYYYKALHRTYENVIRLYDAKNGHTRKSALLYMKGALQSRSVGVLQSLADFSVSSHMRPLMYDSDVHVRREAFDVFSELVKLAVLAYTDATAQAAPPPTEDEGDSNPVKELASCFEKRVFVLTFVAAAVDKTESAPLRVVCVEILLSLVLCDNENIINVLLRCECFSQMLRVLESEPHCPSTVKNAIANLFRTMFDECRPMVLRAVQVSGPIIPRLQRLGLDIFLPMTLTEMASMSKCFAASTPTTEVMLSFFRQLMVFAHNHEYMIVFF
eukprot:Rmarinus@m.2859